MEKESPNDRERSSAWCHRRTPVMSIGVGLGLLVLVACSDAKDSQESSAGDTAPAGGTDAAGSPTAGSSGSAAGSSGAPSATAGSSAAGSSEAGSSAAGSDAPVADAGGTVPAEDAAMPDVGEPDASVATNARPVATSLSFPMTTDEYHDVPPYFIVYRPEDLDEVVAETGLPAPVVVWGDGGCLRYSAAWVGMFEQWAAGGFVVVALDTGPDGNPLAAHTWEDHAAQIDWVFEENARDGSPYAGKLDTTRIVSAGNSCGGVTALSVAANDDRVTAVYVLSGSSALGTTDTTVMGAIDVPVGYSEGGPEDISRAAAEMDYEALPAGVPAMIVARSTGDHLTISYGDQTIVAEESETSLNWMDLALYGTQEAYDALTSDTICTGCEPGLYSLTSKHLETLLR